MKYGTSPQKLHRTDSPSTSIEAGYSVDTTTLERMVHDEIKLAGEKGLIADDLLHMFSDFPYSSITARFSELERKGLIQRNGDKRKGKSGRSQLVMTAVI